MSQHEENLARSIELAKAGFESAQGRIAFIDTKVSAAVGIILLMLPIPLVLIGWLSGLGGDSGARFRAACGDMWYLSIPAGVLLLLGWIAAVGALFGGISCLSPRGSKGHDKTGVFQNEWRPNILFPMFRHPKAGEHNQDALALAHFRQLRNGTSQLAMIEEYEHQLEQLGRILGEKCFDMQKCFVWLRAMGVLYVSGLLLGLIPTLCGIFRK